LKVGITLPHTGEQTTKENIVRTARTAEDEGFDSLWVFDRLLWPISPQSPYPGTPDGSIPIEQQRVFDPLETLTFVAAKTNKIALGTSVIDILFHNPVVLARRFATLDVLSEGRAIAGLGIGWSKDEYQVSNIPVENRGKRADEFIQVLENVWTEDIVEFKGNHYSIPASKIEPKPIQKPHIPIFLGGFSPNTFKRIIDYDTNGWLGLVAGPLEYLENTIKSMKEMASKENKDPNEFKAILLTYPNIVESKNGQRSDESQRFPLKGTVDQIGNDIKSIKEMGYSHIVFSYNFLPVSQDAESVISKTKELSKYAR
jgi:probable F420-dependent oxidoreductase